DYVRRLEEKGAYSEAIERARSLVEAARERLRYWDVSEQQIDALEQTGKVHRTVEFASPASGFIVEKMGNSLEGMKISPGMTVLKLADHSSLWAEVEFYEDDIRHMREGQRVAVEVDAFPGRRWSGKIVLFRPALNPATRTLTALVEIANPGMRLRPQMYANVIAHPGGAARALLVPAQAVLHSGERAVVIVAKGGGLFEPREVQLGLEADGIQQILAGVTQGEEVVTSSQFLIDSESNLRAAIDMLLGNRKPDGIDHPQDSQH
ncbi:MAG: efflux RND transporter periplasmic adaptor subunit, partial [Bryobacterales bacterium]